MNRGPCRSGGRGSAGEHVSESRVTRRTAEKEAPTLLELVLKRKPVERIKRES